MYQKTTAKHGRHEHTDVTSNIATFTDCSSCLQTQQSQHPLLPHSRGNCIASSIPTCPAPTNKFSSLLNTQPLKANWKSTTADSSSLSSIWCSSMIWKRGWNSWRGSEGLQDMRSGWGQCIAWYFGHISPFYSNLSTLEARYHIPDKFSKFWLRLDKIQTDFAKIGMDKNLEIGHFGIYHLAGFLGVLGAAGKTVVGDPQKPWLTLSLGSATRACAELTHQVTL